MMSHVRSFIVPVFSSNVPLVSLIFLMTFVAFRILLFSSISFHCSFKTLFFFNLSLLFSAFIWVYLSLSPLPFASLLFSTTCKASSDNHFSFVHFFSLGMILITASCTMSWKGQFSFQSQRRTMPKNVQTSPQLHSSHMLAG